jgi:hypothetical protein
VSRRRLLGPPAGEFLRRFVAAALDRSNRQV